MNTYYVLVKTKDEPGAGFNKIPITGPDPYTAIQMAKALYGRLLISESVMHG